MARKISNLNLITVLNREKDLIETKISDTERFRILFEIFLSV